MNAHVTLRPALSLAARMWDRLNKCDVDLHHAEERANNAASGSWEEAHAYEASSDIRREIAGLEAEFRALHAAAFPGVGMAEMAERLS